MFLRSKVSCHHPQRACSLCECIWPDVFTPMYPMYPMYPMAPTPPLRFRHSRPQVSMLMLLSPFPVTASYNGYNGPWWSIHRKKGPIPSHTILVVPIILSHIIPLDNSFMDGEGWRSWSNVIIVIHELPYIKKVTVSSAVLCHFPPLPYCHNYPLHWLNERRSHISNAFNMPY